MTEQTYLNCQEKITTLAFEALALCRKAKDPREKLGHYKMYENLCEGAYRLRLAYHETMKKKERQNVSFAN